MKQLIAMTALLLGGSLAGQAVAQFNTDALNKMQQEGHKILAEARGAQSFRIGKNLCLDSAGTLSVEKCDARVATQQWIHDDEDRLVAEDGRCLNGQVLAKCSVSKHQQWTQDKKGRLVSKGEQCLQVQGKAATAGAKVVARPCTDAKTQIWETDEADSEE